MDFESTIKQRVNVKTLRASMGVRYWEDGEVNGIEDTEGALIPFRDGDRWVVLVDLATGQIANWPQGTTANVHYKVCDDGLYALMDADGQTIIECDGYVPQMLGPEGFGDYVILSVDECGMIKNWRADLSYFTQDS